MAIKVLLSFSFMFFFLLFPPLFCDRGHVMDSLRYVFFLFSIYALHTISFKWFLSSLYWILNLTFDILPEINMEFIRSRLNSSTLLVKTNSVHSAHLKQPRCYLLIMITQLFSPILHPLSKWIIAAIFFELNRHQ